MISSRPSVGEPVPDLEFVDASGRPWRLRDQRGSVIVLIFHRHIH